jgi:hypothetical protein
MIEPGDNYPDTGGRYKVFTMCPVLQAASCLQLGAVHLFLTGDITFKEVAELNTKVLPVV